MSESSEVPDADVDTVRVVFDLAPEDGWPPARTERLWAVRVGDDRARLENTGGHQVEVRQAVLDAFAPLGVDGEGIGQFGLVALNVPASADIAAAKRFVIQGADEGRWHYEEGCVTPAWRAAE